MPLAIGGFLPIFIFWVPWMNPRLQIQWKSKKRFDLDPRVPCGGTPWLLWKGKVWWLDQKWTVVTEWEASEGYSDILIPSKSLKKKNRCDRFSDFASINERPFLGTHGDVRTSTALESGVNRFQSDEYLSTASKSLTVHPHEWGTPMMWENLWTGLLISMGMMWTHPPKQKRPRRFAASKKSRTPQLEDLIWGVLGSGPIQFLMDWQVYLHKETC